MIGSFPFGGTPRLKRYIVASLSSSGEEYMTQQIKESMQGEHIIQNYQWNGS